MSWVQVIHGLTLVNVSSLDNIFFSFNHYSTLPLMCGSCLSSIREAQHVKFLTFNWEVE